ncbi:MAG: DUF1801 domain-containing protein [Ferruginibacter sp.]|nr:DUF1801 domain-containing protein [Ferruginibacter sp.]
MKQEITTVLAYISQLPDERKQMVLKLKETIAKHLPKGFVETIEYGMIAFVVPHTTYPAGYHCNPKSPLPFISIASQKNFVSLYHMGLYADTELLNWFSTEYPKHSKTKLDMGKSCIRFKHPEQIPFKLIAELAKKISVTDWINTYERNYKK